MGFVKMYLPEKPKADNSSIKIKYATLDEKIRLRKIKIAEELIKESKSWQKTLSLKKKKMEKAQSIPNNLISNYNKRSSMISRGSLQIASTRFREIVHKRKSGSINLQENLDENMKIKLKKIKLAYKINIRNSDNKQSSHDFSKTLHFI